MHLYRFHSPQWQYEVNDSKHEVVIFHLWITPQAHVDALESFYIVDLRHTSLTKPLFLFCILGYSILFDQNQFWFISIDQWETNEKIEREEY